MMRLGLIGSGRIRRVQVDSIDVRPRTSRCLTLCDRPGFVPARAVGRP